MGVPAVEPVKITKMSGSIMLLIPDCSLICREGRENVLGGER